MSTAARNRLAAHVRHLVAALPAPQVRRIAMESGTTEQVLRLAGDLLPGGERRQGPRRRSDR